MNAKAIAIDFEVFYGSLSFRIFHICFFFLSSVSWLVVDVFGVVRSIFLFVFDFSFSHSQCVHIYIADNLHIITINGIIGFYRDLIEVCYGNAAAVTVAAVTVAAIFHCCYCCNSSVRHCAK